MDVGVTLVGTAPAEQTHGGTLLHSLDHITVEGLPTDIPSSIEVDVSGLTEIDQAIHVAELAVPEGISVLTDSEQVVAKIAPPHVEKAEEEVEVEAVEGEEAEAVEAEEGEAAAEGGGEGGGD
jgi:large subunit ribosomal protein L25